MLYMLTFSSWQGKNIKRHVALVEAKPQEMKAVHAEYRRQLERWMKTDERSTDCHKDVKKWHNKFRPAVTGVTGFKVWLRKQGLKVREAKQIDVWKS